MNNKFFDHLRKTNDPIAPVSSSMASIAPTSVAPAESAASAKCVLSTIAPTPKSSGRVVREATFDGDRLVRLGIRLSAEGVPHYYYNRNKRNNAGPTMLDVDAKGVVISAPPTCKDQAVRDQLKAAADAIRLAFEKHRGDPTLTHAKLLAYANLYDETSGHELLRVTYQTYEQTINALLNPTYVPPPPRTRTVSKRKAAEEEEDDDDDDDALVGIVKPARTSPSAHHDDGEDDDDDALDGLLPDDDLPDDDLVPVVAPAPAAKVKSKSKSTPRSGGSRKRAAPAAELPPPPKVAKIADVTAAPPPAPVAVPTDLNFARAQLFCALKSAHDDRSLYDALEKNFSFIDSNSNDDRGFALAVAFSALREAGTSTPTDEARWAAACRILAR